MTTPPEIRIEPLDTGALAGLEGRIAVFATPEGKLDPAGRRLDTRIGKALSRLCASPAWEGLKPGEAARLDWPARIAAEAILVVKLARKPGVDAARKAGATLARQRGKGALWVVSGGIARGDEILLGLALRSYRFTDHKTAEVEETGPVTILSDRPEDLARAAAPTAALAEGIYFTRDLVNEPANILTTGDFAARLAAMQELGLDVEILEEAEMKALGMGSFLSVGQGSPSPSKLVVMQWKGGPAEEAPFALVGKGVVFDTGGISLKPGAGMEEMTMDMGGAGVVAGVMRTLALRRAKANVVGLVGLVENMPSGTATRPGDVVRSMKGDTIEVINTDAEGRLVLADVLWYAQERFKPTGIVDLATLTGAIIVALGHENAGLFANDDGLAEAVLKAARDEGEGAWRMPLGPAYDEKLKSRIADMKNVGGRDAGSITAAQFLQRFVKEGQAWVHLDIAGVTLGKSDQVLAPKGATGWGVMTLNRLVAGLEKG